MMPSEPSPDWKGLAKSPGFLSLLQAKKRFLLPSCLFFVTYYFLFLYLVGWHPEWVEKPVLGPLNLAYLFALSQFFMAWGLAALYVRRASGFDREAAAVLESHNPH